MAIKKSAEDYLEAILVLKQQKGVVHSIDVARHMGYSKPSISRAVSNMRQDGLLIMQPGGELELTDEGLRIAETIYERHTVLTLLFTRMGVSEKTAAEDACRVEHALSEETFDRIKAAMRAPGYAQVFPSAPAGTDEPAERTAKTKDKKPKDDKKKKPKKKK